MKTIEEAARDYALSRKEGKKVEEPAGYYKEILIAEQNAKDAMLPPLPEVAKKRGNPYGESVEHKHEWIVTFKDGRAYIKCTICGASHDRGEGVL